MEGGILVNVSVVINYADNLRLAEEVDRILMAGADSIRLEYASKNSDNGMGFGSNISRSLREHGVSCPIEVDLYSDFDLDVIRAFAESGVNAISFPCTTVDSAKPLLDLIKSLGCRSGVSFPLGNALCSIDDIVGCYDFLLMTQCKNTSSLALTTAEQEAIRKISDIVSPHSTGFLLQRELSPSAIQLLSETGVSGLVVGKELFTSGDYYSTIRGMRKI